MMMGAGGLGTLGAWGPNLVPDDRLLHISTGSVLLELGCPLAPMSDGRGSCLLCYKISTTIIVRLTLPLSLSLFSLSYQPDR